MSRDAQVVVEFLAGSRIHRARPVSSPLPVLRNGPPGTFVDLPIRVRVSLPTDQIVLAEDAAGGARVGFGGMRFDGLGEDGALTFLRVRDLVPEHELSPERGQVMKLDPAYVQSIMVAGRRVWPE
jgi:hypothetical protein